MTPIYLCKGFHLCIIICDLLFMLCCDSDDLDDTCSHINSCIWFGLYTLKCQQSCTHDVSNRYVCKWDRFKAIMNKRTYCHSTTAIGHVYYIHNNGRGHNHETCTILRILDTYETHLITSTLFTTKLTPMYQPCANPYDRPCISNKGLLAWL